MKQPITKFGAAIQKERHKRNLSQRDVARATKISSPYMNQMEVSDYAPDPFYVVRVAEFFGIESARWLKLALPEQFKLWSEALRDRDAAG